MKFESVLKDYYIDPRFLSAYRIIYCFIIIFILGLPSYSWIANSLNYLYSPPTISITALFTEFPEPWVLITLTILNICFFMLMFLGIATTWTSLLFTITSLIGHNFWYSFGKIDHFLLWYIAPAFLGLAGWGRHFSVSVLRKDRHSKAFNEDTNAVIILIFAISIGFSMMTSAVAKISGGWLNWEGEGVRYNFLRNFLSLNRDNLLTQILIDYKNHFFWKFLDYSALIFEFGFIISVLRIKFFRIFLAIGVIFHVLVLLMFDIAFYSNLIVYLIFIDWAVLSNKWKTKFIYDDGLRELRIVRFIIVISIITTTVWLGYLYHSIYFFTFPGLLQAILSVFAVPNAFETSLTIFFFLMLIFTMYMVYCHIESYYKNRRKHVRL